MNDRELVLRLRFDGDAVQGELDTAEGDHRDFSGWLSLLSVLQTLRPTAPEPD